MVKPTGYQYLNQQRVVYELTHGPWFVEQIGKLINPLTATFWRGVDSSAHTFPVPGKISLYINNVSACSDRPLWWIAKWKRVAHKYGSRINMTVVCKTQGYFHDGPPLSPVQEADRLDRFFGDDLQLPVTLAVQETPVQQLPDGRRVHGKAPYEEDQYYRYSFILTDQTGRILLIGDPDNWRLGSKTLEAYLDRTLGEAH
jgi:hypothetical protein